MRLNKIRSYREVLDQLFNVFPESKSLSIEFVGFVEHGSVAYPLFCLVSNEDGLNPKKNVLISAGIHGEEPAGVYTLLNFLKEDISSFVGNYRFLIFPCINPFGFEHGYRFNPKRLDINREFKLGGGRSYEANKVMDLLARKSWKFDFTVDLHETDPGWADEGFTSADNPKTFYMWETCSDKSLRIGDRVIKEVKKVAPVCEWEKVYNDTNHGGVIWYPEGCGNEVYAQGTTLDAFLNAHYTPQSFTLETPCGWSMEKRIFTHLAALRSILKLKRDA